MGFLDSLFSNSNTGGSSSGGAASNAIGAATGSLTGGVVNQNTPGANNPASISGSPFVGLLNSLFGGFKGSSEDWKGWDAQDSQANRDPGYSPAWWIHTDGDSVQNEAGNVISYINGKSNGLVKVISAAVNYLGYTEESFLNKLYEKLNRGGYSNEANTIKKKVDEVIAAAEQNNYYNDSSDGSEDYNESYSNYSSGSNNSSNNSQQGITAQQIAAIIAATTGNNNNSQQKKDTPDYTWLYISLAVVAIAVIAFFAFKNR